MHILEAETGNIDQNEGRLKLSDKPPVPLKIDPELLHP